MPQGTVKTFDPDGHTAVILDDNLVEHEVDGSVRTRGLQDVLPTLVQTGAPVVVPGVVPRRLCAGEPRPGSRQPMRPV